METINKNEHGAYLMSTVTFLCRGKFNEMLRPDDDGANVLGADGFIVALLAHTNNILSLSLSLSLNCETHGLKERKWSEKKDILVGGGVRSE